MLLADPRKFLDTLCFVETSPRRVTQRAQCALSIELDHPARGNTEPPTNITRCQQRHELKVRPTLREPEPKG